MLRMMEGPHCLYLAYCLIAKCWHAGFLLGLWSHSDRTVELIGNLTRKGRIVDLFQLFDSFPIAISTIEELVIVPLPVMAMSNTML